MCSFKIFVRIKDTHEEIFNCYLTNLSNFLRIFKNFERIILTEDDLLSRLQLKFSSDILILHRNLWDDCKIKLIGRKIKLKEEYRILVDCTK